jgi:hypothetical protein
MFRISYGFQCRQYRRYIAESTTGDQGAGNDDITNFLWPLIVKTLLEESAILKVHFHYRLHIIYRYVGYSGKPALRMASIRRFK